MLYLHIPLIRVIVIIIFVLIPGRSNGRFGRGSPHGFQLRVAPLDVVDGSGRVRGVVLLRLRDQPLQSLQWINYEIFLAAM